MGILLRFLVLACVVQVAGAQGLFKGFVPDENGTNLDAPQSEKIAPKVAAGTIFKDCAECPEMVVVPAGGFTMGSSSKEQALANAGGYDDLMTDWERPQHYVQINSFAAGRGVVTRGEFANFVRATGYSTDSEKFNTCFEWSDGTTGPVFISAIYNWRSVGFPQSDDHPVVCLSFNDAQAYIDWLNQKSGKRFRLFSEAEWEYAARGGTQTPFWWGSSVTISQANYKGSAASFNGSPKGQWRQATVPAKSFRANPFGLFNVHGNVSEWVEDCWHQSYNGAPKDGSVWNTDCDAEVTIRNGAWNSESAGMRSAVRFGIGFKKNYAHRWMGFRLARDL